VVRPGVADRHRRDARVREPRRGRRVRSRLDLDGIVRRQLACGDRRAVGREAREFDLRGGDRVIDDPADVAKQYASEANLRARQALWEEVEGENAPVVLWRTIAEWEPTDVLEVGGGQGELAAAMQNDL